MLAANQAFSALPAQRAVVQFLGLSSFFLLCVSLIVGPLAVLKPAMFAQLIEPRKAVGIAAFVFTALHALFVLSLYFKWDLASVFAFFPLVIALPAFVILLALALTSSDWATKKLGMANWKLLHRFVYIAFALSMWHFVLQANGLFSNPLIPGMVAFSNLAEIALLLLGLATIALQAAGFYVYGKRRAAGSNPAASE